VTTEASFSPLALLGAGYIGGSVALAARRVGAAAHVIGYDHDPAAAAVARQRGILDETAATPEEAVAGAALVVLAAPVASLGPLASRIARAVSPEALVIDVGSVKSAVVSAVEAAMPSGRFVGCHPMAGNERSGPAAADAGLFLDRICFVCPGGRASPAAVSQATVFWQALGARVVTIAPDPHDAAMAAVSHLPHVAAFALAASLAERLPELQQGGSAGAPTTSLRDTTRIAASSPAVWRDIFLQNRAHLVPLVRALEGQVGALRAAIEAGDGPALEALLAIGRATREALTGGSGG
jgi:prephenate dehydrogenase